MDCLQLSDNARCFESIDKALEKYFQSFGRNLLLAKPATFYHFHSSLLCANKVTFSPKLVSVKYDLSNEGTQV